MARVRVAVPEEELSISDRAAKLLGEEKPSKPAKRSSRKRTLPRPQLIRLIVIVGVVLVVAAFILLLTSRNSLQKKVDQLSATNTTQQQANNNVADVVAKISKFLELPQGETPTLATVSDVEKVNNQAFFKNAQNGDQVLLYAQSGKAVLYRPSTNKVIEVAEINTPANQTKP